MVSLAVKNNLLAQVIGRCKAYKGYDRIRLARKLREGDSEDG